MEHVEHKEKRLNPGPEIWQSRSRVGDEGGGFPKYDTLKQKTEKNVCLHTAKRQADPQV